jgi:transketolase
MNLDVCIVALGAGFSYGTAGYSHHLVEDISALSALPNLNIYSPADTLEVELLFPKILANRGPRYLRLGKGGEGRITDKFKQVASGISILSGSSKLAVITTGNIISEVILALKDISPEFHPTVISVSDFNSLKGYIPEIGFDRIITVEEHLLRGGFGSIILELLSNLNCNLTRIGISSLSSEINGSQQFLRRNYGLDSVAITQLVRQEFAAIEC